MPLSAADGRGWIYERIRDSSAGMIVDAGAGEGTYSTLARHLRLDARWVALEIHEPYIERFLLGQKYDDVIVADVRDWKPELTDYLILFGDVLEHMEREDALKVLDFHLQRAEEVMVSVPIIHSPQEACFGNPYEEHLYHWDYAEMLDLLPGCEAFRGVQVGRYWWRREE